MGKAYISESKLRIQKQPPTLPRKIISLMIPSKIICLIRNEDFMTLWALADIKKEHDCPASDGVPENCKGQREAYVDGQRPEFANSF